MAKFRTKPIVVDAVQFNGYHGEWFSLSEAWIEQAYEAGLLMNACKTPDSLHLILTTARGGETVFPGDWIIKDDKGALHVCKKEVFAAVYEEVA